MHVDAHILVKVVTMSQPQLSSSSQKSGSEKNGSYIAERKQRIYVCGANKCPDETRQNNIENNNRKKCISLLINQFIIAQCLQ